LTVERLSSKIKVTVANVARQGSVPQRQIRQTPRQIRQKSKMTGPKEDFILMVVGGLTLDPNTKMPIVVLKDPDNKLNLPIWIGPLEAASMARRLKPSRSRN
jgi:hypothetical protein